MKNTYMNTVQHEMPLSTEAEGMELKNEYNVWGGIPADMYRLQDIQRAACYGEAA